MSEVQTLSFVRYGDFYESFGKDAQKVREVLGLTLYFSKSLGRDVAGFPVHALEGYRKKAKKKGFEIKVE